MKQVRMNRILKRAFPNLEIIEAKEPLLLFPTRADFEKGKRLDPQHCGFANCASRICGSTQAHFFNRYVYIDRLGEDGKRRVYRYMLTKSAFDALQAFDEGRKVKVERAFVLRPPAPSETLAGMRKANAKWQRSDAFKAMAKEKMARAELRTAERQVYQATVIAKSADATPGSAKAKEITRRVDTAKAQLSKARDNLDSAIKRVKEVRRASYGTAKAKPRKRNLHVRSGTGAWLATPAAA